MIDPLDIVGLAEIAIRAGVTNAAVANWAKRRKDFPPPLRDLICGPVYAWPLVADWLDEHDMPSTKRPRPALTDATIAAIAERADQCPLWSEVGSEFGVSARTVQLIMQAHQMGEDFGWHTRQRREGRS